PQPLASDAPEADGSGEGEEGSPGAWVPSAPPSSPPPSPPPFGSMPQRIDQTVSSPSGRGPYLGSSHPLSTAPRSGPLPIQPSLMPSIGCAASMAFEPGASATLAGANEARASAGPTMPEAKIGSA